MIGLSTSGSISLGCAFVAGRNRVPRPAAGKTAFRTDTLTRRIVADDTSGAHVESSARIMLDPEFIREHTDEVRTGLRNRGLDADKILGDVATFEALRRRLIVEYEGLKRLQNTSGDEIAKAKRQGKDAGPAMEASRARAAQIKQLGVQLDSIEHQRDVAMEQLPNLPHAS